MYFGGSRQGNTTQQQKVEIETVARTEWIYLQIIMMNERKQMKEFYEYTQE